MFMSPALKLRWSLECALLACAPALCVSFRGAPPSTVEITSPAERQVFQRDAEGFAQVRVTGRAPDDVLSVGLRVLRADGKKVAIVSIQTQDDPQPGRGFEAVLSVPAGGWYALEAGAQSADLTAPFEPTRIESFGVGEVFVIAGQSNSANWGETRTPSRDDLVSAFDGEHWTLAADPMPGVQDGSSDGSPWPLFGRLLRTSTGLPIGLASVGYGGTSIRQWQPGVRVELDGKPMELYAALRQRVASLGPLRAILWHQGESDAAADTTADLYIQCFEKLSSTLRNDTGCRAPWVVARASFLPGLSIERRNAIRDAQAELWKRGLALQGPDTDDMLGPLRHSVDHVHFSAAGLEMHAQRWFALVWAQIFASPALGPRR